MSFLNPLMLLALAAASIPLLLHLLNLRRGRTVEFSSVRFLRELQQSKLRSFRLQQILLLLLRLGVVVFTVLAFSGPVIGSSSSLSGARSIVILVDNTWSGIPLTGGVEGEEFWRTVGIELIERRAQGDEYTVLPLSDPDVGPGNGLRREKGWGIERMRSIRSGYRTAGYAAALQNAERVLESASGVPHVYLITDRQQVNVAGRESAGKVLPDGFALHVVAPEPRTDRAPNLSIDSLRTITGSGNGELRVIASVRNRSDVPSEGVSLRLRIDGGNGGSERVDLGPDEARDVTLRGSSRAGGLVSGSVELEGDDIPWDNVRYFTTHVPLTQSVSVIAQGDDRETIDRVLRLVPSIRPSRNSWGDLDRTTLETDLFVIADPDQVPSATLGRLAERIRNGGGLLLFGGPGMARPETSEEWERALGLALRGTTTIRQNENPLRIGRLERSHPMFEDVFDPSTTGRIPSPEIRTLLPSAAGEPVVLLDNGQPLVSDVSLGGGRIIYVPVPPRSSWSDLHESSLLVPLLLRSIAYLAGGSSRAYNLQAGETGSVAIESMEDVPSEVTLSGPNGEVRTVGVIRSRGTAAVPVDEASIPGNWTVQAGARTLARFSINGDPRESALDVLSEEQLMESLRPAVGSPELLSVSDEYDPDRSDPDGIGLWQILLLLGIACALAELIVGRGTGAGRTSDR